MCFNSFPNQSSAVVSIVIKIFQIQASVLVLVPYMFNITDVLFCSQDYIRKKEF